MDLQQIQKRPKLLAIDDSTMIHRLLKARLKSERLDIHSATSGQQGLATVRSLLPEVILLDIDLPDMDGFAVLSALKSDPATHDIPVIFISGSTETSQKIRGLEMGAIDFVTKPFDIGELKARVRSALRIRILIQLLAQRAQLDGLTGLWNRAYFDQRLEEEVSIAERHISPLSLVLCDLDQFKAVNDTYGHPFGDQVLEEFARVLSGSRTGDVACRYGGDEFAAILPRTPVAEAVHVAQRYCQEIKERAWMGAYGLVVTASFGVADLECVKDISAKALLEAADAALYEAKKDGRNRVIAASRVASALRASA